MNITGACKDAIAEPMTQLGCHVANLKTHAQESAYVLNRVVGLANKLNSAGTPMPEAKDAKTPRQEGLVGEIFELDEDIAERLRYINRVVSYLEEII